MRPIRPLLATLSALLALVAGLLACQATPPPFFYDFEHDRDLDRLGWRCGVVFAISREHATHGKHSLEMTIFPPARGSRHLYRGVSFRDFNPDWRGASALGLEITNPHPRSLSLVLRIDDRQSPPYHDRFNAEFRLLPGLNRITLPLADLATSDGRRACDLAHIVTVSLFVAAPSEIRQLYIDNCRLSR